MDELNLTYTAKEMNEWIRLPIINSTQGLPSKDLLGIIFPNRLLGIFARMKDYEKGTETSSI